MCALYLIYFGLLKVALRNENTLYNASAVGDHVACNTEKFASAVTGSTCGEHAAYGTGEGTRLAPTQGTRNWESSTQSLHEWSQ